MGKNALSLFSSAGIGELGIQAAGMSVLVSNELVPARCDLYRENYRKTHCLCGDIWEMEDKIVSSWSGESSEAPFLIYATPPCQGMSSNGAGKLLREIRDGNRKPDDPRNRLIIPTLRIVRRLKPLWLLLENVPTMNHTVIRGEDGNYINVVSYMKRELGQEYVGGAEIVNCADYGIPQARKRLISIFSRDEKAKEYFLSHGTFLPPVTHTESGGLWSGKWVTLRNAIGDLPKLDAVKGRNENRDFHEWHFVSVMNPEKHWWLDNTPEGDTAYNNQCVNPECGFQGNPTHGSNFDGGTHSSNKDTPIYCQKCGKLLPRPSMIDKKTGRRRLIKGYDTAYRRMEWDKPAPTLTQNFIFEASDKKVHPSQTRVLSMYEAMILQTISSYHYAFAVNGKPISRTQCAEIIGESVPPKLIELICDHILKISQ